jgi:DNA-binding FadR family transcriptional regulator
VTVVRDLVEQLGQAIVSGVFKDAPFPTEDRLCRRYGVGRPTAREAVKMLVAKGLLHGRSGSGTFVASETAWRLFDPDVLRWLAERRFSLSTLIHLTELRLGGEPVAAALAAQRMTDAERRALKDALLRIEAAERGEGDLMAAKAAFHLAILSAARNPLYHSLEGVVLAGLMKAAVLANRLRFPREADAYERLCRALVSGDGERAQEAMQGIITDVLWRCSAARALLAA